MSRYTKQLFANNSEQGGWVVNDSVTHRLKAINLLVGTARLIDLNLFISTFITPAQLLVLTGKSLHLRQGMMLWEHWHPWGMILQRFLAISLLGLLVVKW